jgi:hypothetical protein
MLVFFSHERKVWNYFRLDLLFNVNNVVHDISIYLPLVLFRLGISNHMQGFRVPVC